MKRRGIPEGMALIVMSAVLFFVLGLYFSSAAPAQSARKKESCVTDKCHSNIGKERFVHGPVGLGDCLVCHEQKGRHKFAEIKNPSTYCYMCHDRLNTKKSVHRPVKDGNCTLCHDPHQSPYRYQLRAEGTNLCFMCHDSKMAKGKYIHGPVAVGGCIMCHNPHQSDFPRMLPAAGNDVCFQCHTDKAEAFKEKKFMHPPVKDSCTNCHSPHAGDYKYNLPADGSRDLCLGCHVDKKDWIENVKVKHGGLETPRKCLACHDPHVSDYGKQLVKEPEDLCFTCHNQQLDTPNGGIMNMEEYLKTNKDAHGPIRQKDCSACHNPHGSDNFRILRKYFPPVFYAAFDVKNYELCFNCHEKTLVLEPRTTTLTNFRNGDQNLHYLHVHKAVKGRTCRACHDPHASNNPKHIRDSVPFGRWDLPLNFNISPDGGSCQPGCHQRFTYDRKNPVMNR